CHARSHQSRGDPLMARGNAGPVDRLVQMGHLDKLVADVRDAFDPVVVGDGRRGADQHVAYARLANVATAMIANEPFDQRRDELELSIEENELVRYEDILEDDH